MRLRCRIGIHDWNLWELLREDGVYYTQATTCKCCGIIRMRKTGQLSDRS